MAKALGIVAVLFSLTAVISLVLILGWMSQQYTVGLSQSVPVVMVFLAAAAAGFAFAAWIIFKRRILD